MRLRFLSHAKQKPALSLNNDNEPHESASAAITFIFRRAALLVVLTIPVLYIVHLFLLAVYSRVLSHPHYHQFEPPGLHSDLQTTNHGDRAPLGQPSPDRAPHDKPAPHLPPAEPHDSLLTNPPEHAHIIPPPSNTDRISDVSNTFKDYANYAECGISSLDLHLPIHPSCDTRGKVLEAMSYGGRAGFDQPFIPFGCDFRWYSTEEICTIIGRFSHIFIIGDSLQRMIVTALYILLRRDIGLGGIGEWGFEPAKVSTNESVNALSDCKCTHQFNRHECSHAPIWRYSDALAYSQPHNLPACGAIAGDSGDPFDISYHEMQKYPASEEDIHDMLSAVQSNERPGKPIAFIMHHTFWNDVNVTATVSWIDQLTERLTESLTYLPRPEVGTWYPPGTKGFPRLFVTANAAGVMKNSQYLETQNSNALARFEQSLKEHLVFRQIEMLGMYNMSVQTTSSDGTHANMRTNLLKAQMVLNWLDWVGQEESDTWGIEGVA